MRCYESAFSVALEPTASSLESAKWQSHDTIVQITGATRRSGVSWSFWRTDTAVQEMAGQGIDVASEAAELCRVFPHRTLVMATVQIEVDD
jgi:hypothetical protein